MKTLIQNYVFVPASRQLTLTDIANIKVEQLLLITNTTTGNILYNFADPTYRCTVSNGNVLTLGYNTTTMNASDSIQVFVDYTNPSDINELYPLNEQYTYDVNMEKVLGSQPLNKNGKLNTLTTFEDKVVAANLAQNNNEVRIDCEGYNTMAIQVLGVWSQYLIIEASINGADFYPIPILMSNNASTSGSNVGVFSANGIYRATVSGYKFVRVRFSTYSSGVAQIIMRCSVQPLITPIPTTSNGAYVYTLDTNIASVFGANSLVRQGFYVYDTVSQPTVNPSQPSSYVDNKYAQYPQLWPRLRVEAGGDQKLPFAQEAITNKLKVSNDDERRLLEEILLNIQLLVQNFSLFANTLAPQSQNEPK